MLMGTKTINDSNVRPSIIAVLACDDYGPCEEGPTASCPHCGAAGRYVYTCLMSDGTRKGMMKGCLGTFAKDACAKQCESAVGKKALESSGKGYLSKWDKQVLWALDHIETVGIPGLRSVCQQVAAEKKAWMRSKGYCR